MKGLNKFLLITFLLSALFVLGCSDGPSSGGENGEIQGRCVYDDAATNHQGQAQEPVQPKPQAMHLEITMEGTDPVHVSPSCSPSAKFTGVLSQNTTIDASGGYADVVSFTDGQFDSELGCVVPEITLSSVLSLKVKATLQNTTQNCKDYCEAHARSQCEAQCGANSSQASCRSSCELTASASCQQECTGSTTRRITAETSLTAAQVAELNAKRAGANSIGSLDVDLKFDKISE